ncbi:EF-hand calcium-binding domain-containing 4A-like protein [Labeo rohita]|uniref:EF-hand calcium-binding domain-containing 4A-like protein n=1 Tax=Labeo rohita TaxID=84645 RepID=A0A498P2C6_LABRO|nr:EF-hand calcium-binding domain-containing 4A-like protein [Labeo rohita]
MEIRFTQILMELGADKLFKDQWELCTLWCELQRDKPELLGVLEEVLSYTVSHLQDALKEKDNLEQALRRREDDHDRVVRSMYEDMESQLKEEREKRQALSDDGDYDGDNDIGGDCDSNRDDTDNDDSDRHGDYCDSNGDNDIDDGDHFVSGDYDSDNGDCDSYNDYGDDDDSDYHGDNFVPGDYDSGDGDSNGDDADNDDSDYHGD